MMSGVSWPDATPVQHQVTEEEWALRINLAAVYRLLAHYGMADLAATHTSVVVPGTNDLHFLINPQTLLFEHITASCLQKVGSDGNLILDSPYRVSSAAVRLHSAIHLARPDALCVMHVHTIAGMAVSMQPDGLLPASEHACMFSGCLGYYDIEADVDEMVDNVDSRAAIGMALSDNKALILRNHGLLTCGATVAEAFWLMHTLERACAAQIAAQASGLPLLHMSNRAAKAFGDLIAEKGFASTIGNEVWPSLCRLADQIDPTYRT